MKNILKVKRVIYGKNNTPEELREYKVIDRCSPVGTRSDWIEFASERRYNEVHFLEKDGSIIKEKIDYEGDDMLRYLSEGGEPF